MKEVIEPGKATLDLALSFWEAYKNYLEVGGKSHILSVVKLINIRIDEMGSIVIPVANSSTQGLLTDDRNAMLEVFDLMKIGVPPSITFITEAAKDEDIKKYMISDREKLEHIAKDHPIVMSLVKALDLKPEL